MKTKDLAKLKNIVTFDEFKEEEENYFAEKGVKLIYFKELMKIG